MGQHPAKDLGRAAAARQEEVRRLAGACFVLGAFGIALTAHLGDLTDRPQAMIVPVLLSVASGTLCLSFPWRLYDQRWFLLMCIPANVAIVWGALVTGGVDSPVARFLYVVVAIAGAYRGGWFLGAQVLFTGAMAGLLAALDPGASHRPGGPLAHLLVELFALAAVAVAARSAIPRPVSSAPKS